MIDEEVERLAAIEAIAAVKARYFRGVDTGDTQLVRSVLAEDCVLDYRGCCTDPLTGIDHFPAMNMVVRGRSSWSSAGLAAAGIVSQHQGFNPDITVTGATSAHAVWAMTDRMWIGAGVPFRSLVGYGFYHETYVKAEGAWRIQTLRIQRIRVETA